MRTPFNILRYRLVLRVGLIYVVIALPFFWLVSVAISYSWLPETVMGTTLSAAGGYFLIVLYFASLVQNVGPPDRMVFLKQIIWVYGPWLFVIASYVSTVTFGFSPANSNYNLGWRGMLLYGLLFLATVTWMLMSAGVARAWAIQRAQDPESILQAEKELWVGHRQKYSEARISPRMYYTFLASVAALFFLVVETLVSEFFDEIFGLPGYTGALVAGLSITVLIYPIHKRASRIINLVNEFEKEPDAEDTKSTAAEVARATARYFFRLEIQHGYRYAVFAILFGVVIAAIQLYLKFGLHLDI